MTDGTMCFVSRNLGNNHHEYGEVYIPALDDYDYVGKREYLTTSMGTVYLFDDELVS